VYLYSCLRKRKGEIIMNPQDENQDTVQSSAYNPFPEPQTIPSGWDLSGLVTNPEADSVLDEADSAES
jgi:hypothetical protein